MGGPDEPSALATADEPTSQLTLVSTNPPMLEPSWSASIRPVGPSVPTRTLRRAVFSSVSSTRTRRESSGKRPISLISAATSPLVAWFSKASMPSTTLVVDSTRRLAGPTIRIENCLGSTVGSSSVPRRSNANEAPPAMVAAISTIASGRCRRFRTRVSSVAR